MTTSAGPIELLRRFWWLVVVFAVGGAVVGYIPEPSASESAVVTDPYTATHVLVLNSDPALIETGPVPAARFELFATRGDVPDRVAERVEAETGEAIDPGALAGSVVATFDYRQLTMDFTATDFVAERAELIAQSFAEEFVAYVAETEIGYFETRRAELVRLKDVYLADLERAEAAAASNPGSAIHESELAAASELYQGVVQEVRTLDSGSGGGLIFATFDSAEAVGGDVREVGGLGAPGSRRGRAAMGGFAGAAIGAALAFVLARTDRKMRTRDQVEQVLGMNAHVLVPDDADHDENRLAVVPDRHDPLSDAYRTLRSIISFTESARERTDGHAPVVVVVSPGPGDGKTSSSANIAAAFAETSASTVLVNTDFRRPTLSRRLGLPFPAPVGLEIDEIPHAPAELVLTPTAVSDLSVLDLSPMREHSPTDLARTTIRTLPRVAQISDVVVVDTSPIGATAEVLDLIPLADYVVLVVRLGNTTIQAARRSMEMIDALSNADVLLSIVGGSTEGAGYYYYYGNDTAPNARHRPIPPQEAPARTLRSHLIARCAWHIAQSVARGVRHLARPWAALVTGRVRSAG